MSTLDGLWEFHKGKIDTERREGSLDAEWSFSFWIWCIEIASPQALLGFVHECIFSALEQSNQNKWLKTQANERTDKLLRVYTSKFCVGWHKCTLFKCSLPAPLSLNSILRKLEFRIEQSAGCHAVHRNAFFSGVFHLRSPAEITVQGYCEGF